ncbi:MAG: Crp/Fnr family transcriptional regulator [Calditrichaeota bacterium]|nr:Crp/Fnr family transcriptional regulator [Calditrichota bacterium]
MNKHAILSLFDVFRNAAPALQRAMLAEAQVKELPGGARVFNEGDECKVVPFIGTGGVRVYKHNGNRREVTLYHVGAGESCVMTTSCVVNSQPYPASADAVTGGPLIFVHYPPELIREWVETFPSMREHVNAMMHRRMVHLLELIEDLTFTRMDRRIASFLLQKFTGDGFSESLNITHGQIADELGSAREVVSRLLKELEKSGAVELGRGRVRIMNENMLRLYAGQSS